MSDQQHDAPLVAQFNTCVQCGPDDWDACTETLLVTPTTTVGEILQWWRMVERVAPGVEFRGPIHLMRVMTAKNGEEPK